MFLAVLCLWLGCFAVFLSSKQQRVLSRVMKKELAWLVFTMTILVAGYLFSQQQLVVVACLMVLAYIMVIWLLLVFTQAHYRLSLNKYCMAALSFSAATHWLGA